MRQKMSRERSPRLTLVIRILMIAVLCLSLVLTVGLLIDIGIKQRELEKLQQEIKERQSEIDELNRQIEQASDQK